MFTVLGCLPWMFGFALLGREVGAQWESWKDKLHYVDYAVAALIVGVAIYLGVTWWRGRGSGPTPEPGAG